MIDTEAFKRANALLSQILELPEGERDSFLAAIDDPQLRRLVSELSEADLAEGLLDEEIGAFPFDPDGEADSGLPPTHPARDPQDDGIAEEQPSRIGLYRVEGELGRGGMGVVYLAHDERLDRRVALKVLHPHVAARTESLRRLRREARALAALNHPHIATLYGFEQGRAEPSGEQLQFLVLEHVAGESLAERLRLGPLSWKETLRVAVQVAAALTAAHDRGLVHRDVKPANIRVMPDGNVKLLDFGLARRSHLGARGDSAITEAHAVFGTVSYMSPERARGETADARSDVWSFGCVLYECLTGAKAFAGSSSLETLSAVLGGEPDWRALPREAPAEMVRLLRLCLRKDPDRRLRDLGDVRLRLEDLSGGLTGEGSVGRPGPLRRFARPVPIWVALLAVVLGALGWGLSRLPAGADASPHGDEKAVHAFFQAEPTDHLVSVEIVRDGSAVLLRGGGQLTLRRFDRLATEPLPTHDFSHSALSPDGDTLWLASDEKLYRRDLRGGRIRQAVPLFGPPVGLTALDDAVVVAPAWWSALWRFEPGSELRPWTRLDQAADEISHRWPRPGPDGGVVFTVKTKGLRSFDKAAIAVADRNGRHRVVLTGGANPRWVPASAPDQPGFLLFVSGGNLYAVAFDGSQERVSAEPVQLATGVTYDRRTGAAYYDVAEDGTLVYLSGAYPYRTRGKLVLQRDDGTRDVWVNAEGQWASITRGTPSPQGDRIALGIVEATTTIWIFHLETHTLIPFSDERGNAWDPVWSPDGRRLAYLLDGPSGPQIVHADLLGRVPQPVTEPSTGLFNLLSWTDRGFLFAVREDGESRIYLQHLDDPAGAEPRLVAKAAGHDAARLAPTCDLVAARVAHRRPGEYDSELSFAVASLDEGAIRHTISPPPTVFEWSRKDCELQWLEKAGPSDSKPGAILVRQAFGPAGDPIGSPQRQPMPEGIRPILGLQVEQGVVGFEGNPRSSRSWTLRLIKGWRYGARHGSGGVVEAP